MTGCSSTSSTIRWTSTPRCRSRSPRSAPGSPRSPGCPRGQLWMATRFLDGGGLGIVMPHVDTPEEAPRDRRGAALPAAGAPLGRRRAAAFRLCQARPRRDLRGDQCRDPRHRHAGNPDRDRQRRGDRRRPRHRLAADRHQRFGDGAGHPRRLWRRAHRRRLPERVRGLPRPRQIRRGRRHRRRGIAAPLYRHGRAAGAARQRSRAL